MKMVKLSSVRGAQTSFIRRQMNGVLSPGQADSGRSQGGPTTQRTDLIEIVEGVVRSLNWNRAGKPNRFEAVRSRRSEVVLSLMVYSYAMGQYSTRQILSRLLSDEQTRELCNALDIDAYSFRHFRRVNTDLVHECLVKVFQKFFEAGDHQGVTSDVAYLMARAGALEQEASKRISLAWEQDRNELELLLFAGSDSLGLG